LGRESACLFGWYIRKEVRCDLAYRQRNAYSSSEAKRGTKRSTVVLQRLIQLYVFETFAAIKFNEIFSSRQPCQSKANMFFDSSDFWHII
jgi:hypothetical protein